MIRNCFIHSGFPAAWQCIECGKSFCDQCVKSVAFHNASARICSQCGEKCIPVESRVAEESKKKDGEFWRSLPGAFAYPFRGDGVWFLIVGSIFFSITEIVLSMTFAGLVLALIIGGLIAKYHVKIIRDIVKGKTRPPSWGQIDATDLGSFLTAFFRVIGVVVFCGIAPIAYLIFASKWGIDRIFYALCGLSMLYFPMAYLAALYYEDILEINPVNVFRSIFRVPFRYFTIALVFLFAGALERGAYIGLYIVFEEMFWDASPFMVFFAYFPFSIIHWLIALYFSMVGMFLLGTFLHTTREKLGWD